MNSFAVSSVAAPAKQTVVIVGSSGTVGIDLAQRLEKMADYITVVGLSRDHSPQERQEILNSATIAVLCLPEAAAVEFVQEAKAYPHLRILDASPAHRTHNDWVYGLPELDALQESRIRSAPRVANPGCYATGAILLLRPLMQAMQQLAIEQPDITITAIGGVTSGGRKMIEQAQAEPFGYRLFGLAQKHRHIPEIQMFSGLVQEPILMPAVVAHQRGTMVQIPLTTKALGLSFDEVSAALHAAYAQSPNVQVCASADGVRFLDGAELAGQDGVRIDLLTDQDKRRLVLVVRFDNLGKGAAGAAEQNVRLMLGLTNHD